MWQMLATSLNTALKGIQGISERYSAMWDAPEQALNEKLDIWAPEEHDTIMVILLLVPRGDYSELTYAFIQVTALGHGERVLGSMHVVFASSTKSSCSQALFHTD